MDFWKSPDMLKDKYHVIMRTSLVLFLCIFCFPYSLYYEPGFGLDPSWILALHMAVKQNMSFGKDFMFTYGSLGFLSTRLSLGISAVVYVLFDLYVLANLFYIFNDVLKKNKVFPSFILILISILLIGDFHDHDIVSVLTWIMLYMLFHHFKERNFYILCNAAILVTILFAIKLNLALVAFFIFFSYLGFLWHTKTVGIRTLLYFCGIYALAFSIFCFLTNLNPYYYVMGGLHVISGYNDSGYEPISLLHPATLCALFICLLYAIFLLINMKIITRNKFLLFMGTVISLMVFINFKQGFVRLHTETFFQFITPFISFWFIFSKGVLKKRASQLILLSLFVCCISQSGLSLLFDSNLLTDRLNHFKTYARQIVNSGEDEFKSRGRRIPAQLIKDIKGSVDIMPWDVDYVYYSDLKYNPRPTIQTYGAYDGYLDGKNADRYLAEDGPENLLLRFEIVHNGFTSFDELPLFQETKTRKAIIQNYQIKNNTWEHLLLERLPKPLKIQSAITDEGTGKFSEFIELKNTEEIQCLYAKVKYSVLGKVRRFLFQPPELSIALKLEDGSIENFKAVVPIINDGIIINKFIPPGAGNEEIEALVTFNGRENKRIKAYMLYAKQPWGFVSEYDYKIETLTFEQTHKSKEIYEPVGINIPPSSNDVLYSMESFKDTNSAYIAGGWAYSTNVVDPDSRTFIVLYSPIKSYVFPAQKILRQDVNDIHRRPSDISGFRSVIFKSFLQEGEYSVGIIIQSDKFATFTMTSERFNFSKEDPTPK